MQLAQRLALITAVLSLGAATAACKKDQKDEKQEPAKTGDASGAAVTADAAAKPANQPPAAATAALSGFKGAMAKAGSELGMGGKLGLGGGATGGIGGALGGIFGGGSKAAPTAGAGPAGSEARARDDEPPGDDEPPAEPDIKLPPGKAGGDCEAVTDKLMVIVRGYAEAELGSMSPEERKLADPLLAEELAKVRGQVLKMCVDEQWSAELRDCVLTAPDMAALEGCDQFTPADTAIDDAIDDDDAPEPVATPAPAWTGGDDCGSVGKRLMELAIHGMGELPAEVRAELEAELARSAEEVAAMCTDGGWTVEIRQCVVRSTTMSDAEGCLATLASP